jgi:2-aminobenzoate-CoA ligase
VLRQPDFDPSQLASLRLAVSAAERLPPEVAGEWHSRTGLEMLDGLGSTELAHIFISAKPGHVERGTIGTPVRGYEARIVDAETRELPDGSEGRLAVRGPTGCRYWNDVDAQRRVVRDGWTLTGDISIRRPDGSFEHVSRADELIVSGGAKISPREVERALLDDRDVLRARVFAVPDPVRGFVPKAMVTVRPGAERRGLPERLQAYLKNELASYKCPRQIELVVAPG